ncbi:MAG: ABC transporter permease [Candidatus Thermoplasmatota archaeon]|nr:ABC transporter permease [Candidatus Thermoplasmatota archaeon]
MLSLKIALRPNKRFVLAIIGVAICILYISGTTALVGGLREGRQMLMEENDGAYYLCSKSPDLSQSVFTVEEVGDIGWGRHLWGVLGVVQFCNVTTYVAGFEDYSGLMQNPPVIENENGIILGSMLEDVWNVNCTHLQTSSGPKPMSVESVLEAGDASSQSLFPPDWIFSTSDYARECAGKPAGSYSFFITKDVEGIDTDGLFIQHLTSKEEFFLKGVEQVESNLWLLTSISSIIALLVVYNIMQVEISARKKDIKILRGVGGSRRWIMGVFTFEAGAASFLGACFGIILGIVGANLIISCFSLVGYTVMLAPSADLGSVAVPFTMALATGFVGGATASFMNTRNWMEGEK